MDLDTDEKLIRKSNGNFRKESFSPFGWIGGKWLLTSKRLIFRSNHTNIESQEITIPINEVTAVGLRHNNFISSKLTLFLSDESEIELHVKDRDKWASDIFEMRKTTLPITSELNNFIAQGYREIPFEIRVKQFWLVVIVCIVSGFMSFFLLNVLDK